MVPPLPQLPSPMIYHLSTTSNTKTHNQTYVKQEKKKEKSNDLISILYTGIKLFRGVPYAQY